MGDLGFDPPRPRDAAQEGCLHWFLQYSDTKASPTRWQDIIVTDIWAKQRMTLWIVRFRLHLSQHV